MLRLYLILRWCGMPRRQAFEYARVLSKRFVPLADIEVSE